MRYIACLLVLFVMQVLAWIVTPALPLFAVNRFGPIDNASREGYEPRLPLWLSWFDTPDNCLYGDDNWYRKNGGGYWSMVGWLYRNSLYGFKWSVLSAPMVKTLRVIHGESPTWTKPGFQRIQMREYWQWHIVKRIGPVTLNWNFGWLLNDGDQPRALFMFSPRVRFA